MGEAMPKIYLYINVLGGGGLADIVDESCGTVCCSMTLKLLRDKKIYYDSSKNATQKRSRYACMNNYAGSIKSIYESTLEENKNA